MNPLREWRRLRAVPDVKHGPSHSAGDERPSLAVVRDVYEMSPGAWMEVHELPPDALDDAPPVVPVRVSARPGDPTPIFDAVMGDKWWTHADVDVSAEGVITIDSVVVYHALATQFEVAFMLDEFSDEDRAEIAREAAEDVSFGWGPVA